MALAGGVYLRPAQAEPPPIASTSTAEPTSTSTPRPSITPRPTSTSTAEPTSTSTPQAIGFGWPGEIQCHNCTPFTATVRLSHYDPTKYNPDYPKLNCWDYSTEHKYCVSPTWIGVPWEAAWGWGAACPAEWAIGTWMEIPGVGYFICIDHGGDIVCNADNICKVDLLGPGGMDWEGKTIPITLWVPQSFLIRLSR